MEGGREGGVSSMIDAEIKSVCKDMTTQQMHLPCRFPSPLNYSESVGGGGPGVGALGKKCCDCDWLFFVAICNRDPPTFRRSPEVVMVTGDEGESVI